jgi:hypothetical protein
MIIAHSFAKAPDHPDNQKQTFRIIIKEKNHDRYDRHEKDHDCPDSPDFPEQRRRVKKIGKKIP